MNLQDRMLNYEKAWQLELPPRLPIIARLDGKNFSRLTSNDSRTGKPNVEDLDYATLNEIILAQKVLP